jgi:hypothetical protein
MPEQIQIFYDRQVGEILRNAMIALMNLRRSKQLDDKTKANLEKARDFFDFLVTGFLWEDKKEVIGFYHMEAWKNFQEIRKHSPINSLDSFLVTEVKKDIEIVLDTSKPSIDLETYFAILLRRN